MALWHLSQSENDNLAPHPCLKLEYPMSKAISIVSLQNLNYWHENYVYFSYSLDALKKKWVNQTPIIVGTLVGWEQLRCFSSCSDLNWVRLSIPVQQVKFLHCTEYHFCLVLVLCKQHIVRWICFLWFELGLSWSPVITPGREKTYIFNVVNIEASDTIRLGQNRSATLFLILLITFFLCLSFQQKRKPKINRRR